MRKNGCEIMEKKKNIGLFVIVGILVILLLVVVLLVGVLVWKGTEQRDGQGSNGQGSSTQTAQGTNVELEDLHFVQSGYEFTVPGMYDLTHTDETGVVVYDEDAFQMKIGVAEGSYEEVMSNPEEFTKAIIDAEGTIEQDMKETGLDGKKYAYYRANLQGEAMLVIYTAAPEEGKRIAGQIALLGENVTDEGMLQMFSFIVSSAVATDKADSTKDDIVVEMAKKKPSSIEREWISERTMEFGDAKVTHKIPADFFLDDAYDGSEYTAARYYMVEPRVDVTCTLFDIPWYENIEAYIEESKRLDDTKVQTMDIEGNKVYYIVEMIMTGDEKYQQIYAGCDLGEQQFYVVEADVSNEDIELTMDTIREFLVFE